MNSKHVNNIVIAVIIIIIVLIYLGTFGQVDITDKDERKRQFVEKQKLAEHRHRKLLLLLLQKTELKSKLDRKFKIAYFLSRVILVALYITLNFVSYYFGGANSLEKLLSWNQIAIIIIAAVGFLFYKKLIAIPQVITYFKLRIENWVYGKYLNLPTDIQTLETSIQEEQEKIRLLNT
jgi:hypothetical protein